MAAIIMKLCLDEFYFRGLENKIIKIILDLDGFIREIGMRQKSFDLSAKFV